MHLRFSLTLLTFFCTVSLFSQSLSSSTSQLAFGQVFETDSASQSVTIKNLLSVPVKVMEIRFYSIYGFPAFSTAQEAFTLAAEDSLTFTVVFAPRHNIFHNSEMLLLTDSDRGHLAVDLTGQGSFSNTYYNSTENLSEEALKTALKTRLAQGYIQLSYNGARDEMYMDIDNQATNGQGAPVNTLEGVYTGFTITGYTSRADAQLMGFNTEHTFPQGFFSQNLPMRSDLFHLYPTRINANSERGNLPFGVVTGTPSWADGGSKKGGGVFEPRDIHKGVVARAMMYFVIRYQNYSNFLNGQESILRQWHAQFPPDSINRKRNQDIFAVQGNRNPFIDYPQFIERIHSISGNSVAPVIEGMDLTDTLINFDTLAAFTPATYYFVLVNSGNIPIDITGLSIDHPALTIGNGIGSASTVLPGEALTLPIQLAPIAETSIQANLQFSTNLSGPELTTVPILAEVVGSTGIEDNLSPFSGIRVYPNPTHDEVLLILSSRFSGPLIVSVLNPLGETVLPSALHRQASPIRLSLKGLASGVYFIQANHLGETKMFKVIKD